MIRTESWVKNRDTNRIVGLVYRYRPTHYARQTNLYQTATQLLSENWDKSTIWLDMKEAFLSYFGTSSRIWLCNLNTSHTCPTPAAPRDYLATSRWLKSKHCYGLIPNLSLWKQIIALQEIPFLWALVNFRCYLHWGKVQPVRYSNLKSNSFLYSWTCTWTPLIFVLLVCNHEGF